jgi:hypothetical protein
MMPRYGTVDFEYASRLGSCSPEADGPVLMINYMKYRERALYSDGTDGGKSGIEADDEYAPVDVLADIGAVIAYAGDVVDDTRPKGWDRVAIVQYPSRRAFIEMQSRRDFQAKHEHKDAGMERTIVIVVPTASVVADIDQQGRTNHMVFDLVRHDTTVGVPSACQAVGPVEGTIVGDGRAWTEIRISWVADPDQQPSDDPVVDRERVVVRTRINRLPGLIAAAAASDS